MFAWLSVQCDVCVHGVRMYYCVVREKVESRRTYVNALSDPQWFTVIYSDISDTNTDLGLGWVGLIGSGWKLKERMWLVIVSDLWVVSFLPLWLLSGAQHTLKVTQFAINKYIKNNNKPGQAKMAQKWVFTKFLPSFCERFYLLLKRRSPLQ